MTIYVDALIHNGWPTHHGTCRIRRISSDREDHHELRAIVQDRMHPRKTAQ